MNWPLIGGTLLAGGLIGLAASSAFGSAPSTVIHMNLRNAPFPGQSAPSAVVLPGGLAASGPLDVWVYFRGVFKCAPIVLGEVDGKCTPTSNVHKASHLASQFAASGSKAILFVPELAIETAGILAGTLTEPGRFAALVNEMLAHPSVVARIGNRTVSNIRRLGVMSHSGGIAAAAAVVASRPPMLSSIVLLDSLYQSSDVFAAWIRENAARLGTDRRFADVYTDGGGTLSNSQALASQTLAALQSVGLQREMVDNRSGSTLTPADYGKHVVFNRSIMTHEAMTTYYPKQFWSAGW